MNKEELTKTRVQLYKATPLKLQLVDELITLINNRNEIQFNNVNLTLEGLCVKFIEIDPQELGGVLIHWYPNFKISTQRDPYCSVYILKTNSIRKLISYLQNK